MKGSEAVGGDIAAIEERAKDRETGRQGGGGRVKLEIVPDFCRCIVRSPLSQVNG